jgi:tRNA U34 2-thiouridine synthase MnmA/TrmU
MMKAIALLSGGLDSTLAAKIVIEEGIELLRELSLLKYIIPELEEGYKVGQNKHHIYECYEHSLLSLKYAANVILRK